ncbi:Cof-type HAD-IIB family hydrolase [Buchnera aphidicola (Mindarus keteleerifoliae)]|uniref:Cof-type HAD-IIB family hydrolase n=1 Tax=Buchnera aphidicola TaxID=9 RepID=UPI0031B73BE9
MNYTVISDLDGTLLNDDYRFSKFTKLVIRRLINMKIRFIIATGRHYIDVIKFQKKLDINCICITSNGSRIYDSLGNLIFNQNFSSDISKELQNIRAFDKDIFTHVYKDDRWYVNGILVKEKNNIKNISTFFDFKKRKILSSNISKVYFTSTSKKKILILEKDILNNFKNHVITTYSSPFCLEIMPNKISKGFALKFLSSYFKFHLKKCISFGNSMNDKEMLDISGRAYMVNNADKDLKQSLPNLSFIKNNSEDGVAKFLVNFFNI